MSLPPPSFSLLLILFLGAAIRSSPIFLRTFIDPEAPEENVTMDKRSYNTFPNILAYGFNRGRTAKSSKGPIDLRENWIAMALPVKKLMIQLFMQAKDYENGLNTEKIGTNMSKRVFNPYTTSVYWNPRAGGVQKLMVGSMGALGGLGGLGGKEYPVAKDLAENKINSPARAGFGLSYGRG